MRYSLDEIDQMRRLVRRSLRSGFSGVKSDELREETELRLRTIMANGTKLPELITWVDESEALDAAWTARLRAALDRYPTVAFNREVRDFIANRGRPPMAEWDATIALLAAKLAA